MKSIKMKIGIAITILLLLVCISFSVGSYIASSNALLDNIKTELPQLARQGAFAVEKALDEQWNALELLAQEDAIANPSYTLQQKLDYLKPEVKRSNSVSLAVVDPEGNTLSPDGKPVNVKDRPYFQKAIQGQRAVSDPVVNKSDNKTIIMVYAVPIKWNGNITGVIIAARDGNNLSDITNKITYGSEGKSYMLNNKGTAIAHYDKSKVLTMDNIIDDAAKAPALKGMAEVMKKVIQGGTSCEYYVYNGVEKYVGYAPVRQTDWSLVVTVHKSEILSGLETLKNFSIIIAILILIIGAVVIYVILSFITKPVNSISDYLKTIATGDFSRETPSSLLKLKDEIGALANSANTMQGSIRKVVAGVTRETAEVVSMVNTEESNMAELAGQIEEVSATTEQLSAGMEETAASVEEMNATTLEIEKAVESIAQKAQEGSLTAAEISKRAQVLKKNAEDSRSKANSLYRDTEQEMKKAIAQSSAVEHINTLSATILQISSQTNLLALNASIEAARAGEAGKGFSVVAQEIGKLADQSKNTVAEIQKVTKEVVAAVGNLAGNSANVLEFINHQVLKDYDELVKTGEQYNSDAELVNGIVVDLSATTEQLSASIQNVLKAITEIAEATGEGAEGISHIAANASHIRDKADMILNYARSTKDSVARLNTLVSGFKA